MPIRRNGEIVGYAYWTDTGELIGRITAEDAAAELRGQMFDVSIDEEVE